MSRRWSDPRVVEATACACCGSTLGVCHSWCDELDAHTERPQSLSIGQAVMAVLALYGALVVMIGLAIVWSAAHPSFDLVWVLGMLALVVYILAGEVHVP